MPIDGRTRVAFVLGYPVEHSLSPAMHHAAFRAAGLNAAHLPWSVPPARLEDAVVDLIYRPAETPQLAGGVVARSTASGCSSTRERWPSSAGPAAPPRSTPCGQPWSGPPSRSSRDISLDKQGGIINMRA